MALLTVDDLSLAYESHTILEGLNFSVNAGDYLCILGENGAGKSTLIRTLLRLLKPAAGSIQYDESLANGGIGYLPQQSIVQRDFPASVWEIVLSGRQSACGWRPFYNKEDKQQAEDNLKRLGISDLRKRCYRELSGGQQQRVLLARALCAGMCLLILDEPVSGLDPKAGEDMYQLIDKLNRDGLTIICVTHDMAAALKYASHILHIGDDIFFGSRAEYERSMQGRLFLSRKGAEQ